jgi:transcriptional regulator with XRE-family HTH domain
MRYRGAMVAVRTEVPDPGAIAALVRGVRLEAGLSQAALAERLGTTQSAISRWEAGHDEPRIGSLAAILRACGLRLSLVVETADDGVDRAQIRQQLAMSPDERLASVVNLSATLASARPVA